jgi:uncharacterized protein YndB with AHSA1/START domain
MAQLVVEKSIVIHASAKSIWDVLTDPHLSREWIQTWWPEIQTVESTWRYGDPILWKLGNGELAARGTVTNSHPYIELQFSFRVNDQNGIPKTEQIHYELEQGKGLILLHVKVGNFGDSQEHEACYAGAIESWNKALPKIRELAEKNMEQTHISHPSM